MPDQDRLRAELSEILLQHREWMRGIRTDHLIGTSDEQTQKSLLALIAREVRLARLDELKRLSHSGFIGIDGIRYEAIKIGPVRDRIAQLEKETP